MVCYPPSPLPYPLIWVPSPQCLYWLRGSSQKLKLTWTALTLGWYCPSERMPTFWTLIPGQRKKVQSPWVFTLSFLLPFSLFSGVSKTVTSKHPRALGEVLRGSFYRKGNWGSESVDDFPESTQLIHGRTRTRTPGPYITTLVLSLGADLSSTVIRAGRVRKKPLLSF